MATPASILLLTGLLLSGPPSTPAAPAQQSSLESVSHMRSSSGLSITHRQTPCMLFQAELFLQWASDDQPDPLLTHVVAHYLLDPLYTRNIPECLQILRRNGIQPVFRIQPDGLRVSLLFQPDHLSEVAHWLACFLSYRDYDPDRWQQILQSLDTALLGSRDWDDLQAWAAATSLIQETPATSSRFIRHDHLASFRPHQFISFLNKRLRAPNAHLVLQTSLNPALARGYFEQFLHLLPPAGELLSRKLFAPSETTMPRGAPTVMILPATQSRTENLYLFFFLSPPGSPRYARQRFLLSTLLEAPFEEARQASRPIGLDPQFSVEEEQHRNFALVRYRVERLPLKNLASWWARLQEAARQRIDRPFSRRDALEYKRCRRGMSERWLSSWPGFCTVAHLTWVQGKGSWDPHRFADLQDILANRSIPVSPTRDSSQTPETLPPALWLLLTPSQNPPPPLPGLPVLLLNGLNWKQLQPGGQPNVLPARR